MLPRFISDLSLICYVIFVLPSAVITGPPGHGLRQTFLPLASLSEHFNNGTPEGRRGMRQLSTKKSQM